ncbi:MAG: hypothetical protein KBB37_13055 [Bacteroidia bacterium]|jgi:hypothetical protein|nr:hypothetical protein [Bacteroidia bacterium]MBP7262205.1 hypothetical protein [Bacteroidia bacterium]MBP9725749.1 hypothetical protein [Bacteroidia bacterium]
MRIPKIVISILLFLFIPLQIFAQGDGGGDDPDVPIDGGISLLLVAGGGYAIKRLRDKSSDNDESNTD